MRNRTSFIATKRVLTVKFYGTLSVIITSLQRIQTYISVSSAENANSRNIGRAQVKVGLINLCKGLFSLNARTGWGRNH